MSLCTWSGLICCQRGWCLAGLHVLLWLSLGIICCTVCLRNAAASRSCCRLLGLTVGLLCC